MEVRQGGGIEYSLVWDWSGATREQGTGKWRFVTSKGVEFRLSAVYSHISVLQLVPCEKTSSSTPGAANWFGRTMQWLTLGVALSEHA